MDRFTQHLGAVVVAVVALSSLAAIIWQVTHGHEVEALLSGICLGAIGVLSPSPIRQTVQVDQPADKPVPVDPAPAADGPEGPAGLLG